jgi:hypothetical protein
VRQLRERPGVSQAAESCKEPRRVRSLLFNKGFLRELKLSERTKKLNHYISSINKEKLKILSLFWNGQKIGGQTFCKTKASSLRNRIFRT